MSECGMNYAIMDKATRISGRFFCVGGVRGEKRLEK